MELGYNGGSPIDEAFFRARIAGRHNPEIAAELFPEWPAERRTAFYMDKEVRAWAAVHALHGQPRCAGDAYF